MSYQNELEQAIEKLTDDELKETLIEICLIVNRGNSEEKQTIEQDIVQTINTRVLKEQNK